MTKYPTRAHDLTYTNLVLIPLLVLAWSFGFRLLPSTTSATENLTASLRLCRDCQTCLLEAEDELGSSASPPEAVCENFHEYFDSLTDEYAGGKKFSKDLTPLDADGNPISMWGVSLSLYPT